MSYATLGQQLARLKSFRSHHHSSRYNDKMSHPNRMDLPPPYEAYKHVETGSQPSKWNPANWSWKTRIFAVLGAVVILLAVILGTYFGLRANAYPDYSKLNYSLVDSYSGTSFFDNFNYYTGYDTTSGFVHYVDSATAEYMNLTYASSSRAILRVDTSETDASTGRKSVRITSKNTYNTGLFIFDVYKTPYACGTWPALWLSDPANWPEHGEIDVVESVNTGDTGNQMTLHTSDGCKMDRKRKETGSVLETNCWNETNSNAGCGVEGTKATYGEKFNDNGGGVYAMELRDAGIRVWLFDHDSLPSDLSSLSTANTSSDSPTAPTSPDPSGWGEALADFPSTDCDISSHFKNQSIIANIDLCGTWAGATSVYNDQYGCSGLCTDFVAQNADAFDTAVWEWGGFWVYGAT